MKNTIITLLLLFSFNLIAQDEELYKRELPVNESGKIEMSSVFECPGKNKDLLFLNIKTWVTQKYISSNGVIQLDDKEAGLFIIRVVNEYEDFMKYNQIQIIKFQVKDEKCKVTLSNIKLNYTYGGILVDDDIEKTIIEDMYKSNGKPNKGSKFHKEKLIEFWDLLNVELPVALNSNENKNDW
jgi:hypothetical protein